MEPEDIEAVNAAEPDWCGFVIGFPKSHRNRTPEQVRALRRNLSPGIPAAGVTVNLPVEEVAALLRSGTVDIAQLHGQEDEDYIARLRALVPGCTVWKAFRVRSAADLEAAERSSADMVILDNGYGTGKCFDWSLAGGVKRPFLLAGGLTPENIPEAAALLHPYGVDISSGVETDRRKDPAKIQAAVAAARKE